ncbi:MAG: HEAT repeat domain-containing protein [Acidimicrobiales bacterium]
MSVRPDGRLGVLARGALGSDILVRVGTAPSGPPRRPDRGTSPEMQVVLGGYGGDMDGIARARHHLDPRVRAARLGALQRLGRLTLADLTEGFADADASVRLRALEAAAEHRLAPKQDQRRQELCGLLTEGLGDPDALVAEAAAWALGEHKASEAVGALAEMARAHPDPRCREAAVAALGAIGHRGALQTVIDALADRPPVRRRAVVALAAFDGSLAEDALRRCLQDRDWQVRQSAEALLRS